MNVEKQQEILNAESNLFRTLGMQLVSTPEADAVAARMPVDGRTRQVFGYLSGGATLALAETLAGVGSRTLCPGRMPVGVNVSASHVRAVPEGDTVMAVCRLVNQGRKLHTWRVDVSNSRGELISTVTVTNYVLAPGKAPGGAVMDNVSENEQ